MPVINLIEARIQEPITQHFFHEWIFPNGTPCATFHRLEDEYLIRFPNLADFILSKNGLIIAAYPTLGVSNQTIEHLYLNQVAPLALSCQLKLVLHGSAVELDDYSVGFLGASGRGKSTLAASFSTSGYRFLTDDGLLLEKVNSQYFVQPNHPSIRLWDDSREKLIPDAICSAPALDYTLKARLLAGEQIAFCDEARPLRFVYFLGEGNADVVSITPVSGCEAMIELQKHSFLLDMEEREMLTHHFKQISALAKHPIFFRLEYPHRYEDLDEVRESVVKHSHASILP